MSNEEFVKGDERTNCTGTDDGASLAKKLWEEFDASYPPFRQNLKFPCIIAAIATLIICVIAFSIVFTNLPSVKQIISWQEGTPEPEGAVKSVVIAIVIGIVVIIAAVVAAVFITRAVAKKLQAKNYIGAKMRLFAEYKNRVRQDKEEIRKREEEQKKWEAIFTCEFCGGIIECKTDKGTLEQRGYVQDAYRIKVTGYSTAEITPTTHTIGYQEYSGGKIVCRCRKCKYEIMKRERSDHRGYDRSFPVTIELYDDCKLTKPLVKNTKVYRYVDDYVIDVKY